MRVHVEKKEHKPLVEREELHVRIENTDGTISNAQLREEIAKYANKPSEVVVVKKILQAYGKREANALVYVYSSPETLKKFEPTKKEKKAVAGATPAKAEEKK